MQPVPVDQRCQFLSAAWIDAATAFLIHAVRARPELADFRCTVSHAYNAAPPSLGAPDNRAAWSFAIRAGDVQVRADARDDADLRVTGDYQAALAMAQTVHAAGPDAMARAQRELRHRAGPAAIKHRRAAGARRRTTAARRAARSHGGPDGGKP